MNELNGDTGIPMLTEVIDQARAQSRAAAEQSAAGALTSPTAPPPLNPPKIVRPSSDHLNNLITPAINTASARLGAPSIQTSFDTLQPHQPAQSSSTGIGFSDTVHGESDWQRLEQKVSARVLQQLTSRVDRALDQRIRDSIATALQPVIDNLADELRQSLQFAIEDVIRRAIAQEISVLQALKK